MWQNFSLLFDAVDSEKYLVYAVAYVKHAIYRHNRAQYGATHLGSVYCVSQGKYCEGTILPSVEQNWLKWS